MLIQTGRRGDQPGEPGLHLVGRLVGEGQGQDLRAGDALLQQVGDAMRDHARLAAARPGQNQQRAIDMLHRLELGGGERFENVGSGGSNHRIHTNVF